MFKLLSRLYLRWHGWKTVGTWSAEQKFVLIAAPHTSNWDLIHLLAVKCILEADISVLIKHTAFWWPLGPILRAVGAIPVRRDHPERVVEQIVRIFDESERLCLLITPEGTRGYAPHWKSGFYRIAMAAGVPIQLGFVDYAKREAGFGPLFMLSGDVRADMDKIRAFYADRTGRYPEQAGEVRLHEEDDAIASRGASASVAESTGVRQT